MQIHLTEIESAWELWIFTHMYAVHKHSQSNMYFLNYGERVKHSLICLLCSDGY